MKAKAGQIKAGWMKSANDNGWCWGDGTSKADANLVGQILFLNEQDWYNNGFCSTLIEELEKRGYDPKTLKFSIEKKKV